MVCELQASTFVSVILQEVPNSGCRYTARASEKHLVSLQVSTSKPDVYIKLQVLDNEQEILNAVGKGHVVIPSCIFQKDPDAAESKRAESRACKYRLVVVDIVVIVASDVSHLCSPTLQVYHN